LSGHCSYGELVRTWDDGVQDASTRLFHIDVARATAVSLVTGFHLWRFFGYPELDVGPVKLSAIFSVGFVGVDVFFVVSGYAMMLTWDHLSGQHGRRAKLFLFSRMLRICPTYFAAILFWCIAIQWGVAEKPHGIVDVLTHVTFTHTLYGPTFFSISGPMWSLGVEAHFYLLFPMLVLLPRRWRLVLCGASLAAVALMAGLFAGRSDDAAIVAQWNVVCFLPLFVIGIELYRFGEQARRWGGMLLLCGLVLIFTNLASSGDGWAMFPRMAVGACIGAGLILAVPKSITINLLTRAVTLIATASYSIYLYNYIIYVTTSPFIGGVVGAVVYVAVVFGFGLLMWAAIERHAEMLRRNFVKRFAATLQIS
jgi:peptidoglycan/LPS O-acetylase OafA/YrhL